MTNKDAHRFVSMLLGLTVTPETKLEHARNQTLKNAGEFVERYNERLEDLNIDFCSVNDKGHILKDQNGERVFTKDNQRALSKEIKTFLNADLIVPFEIVTTADTKGLTDLQLKHFIEIGFIKTS